MPTDSNSKSGFFRSMFNDEKGNVSSKRVIGSFVVVAATLMCIASGLEAYEPDVILIAEQYAAGGILLGVTAFTNILNSRRESRNADKETASATVATSASAATTENASPAASGPVPTEDEKPEIELANAG